MSRAVSEKARATEPPSAVRGSLIPQEHTQPLHANASQPLPSLAPPSIPPLSPLVPNGPNGPNGKPQGDGSKPATIARFGKYHLILDLGHGGMADVFLAVASGQLAAGVNKLLVIKRLRPSLAGDPEFIGMLVDEARLAARLNHPNVVQTNEIGHVGRQYFIAMEYLDGQPFHHLIVRARKRMGQMALDIGCTILCDVLGGLQYAHDLTDYDGTPLSIVHRDVSPHNVFVTYAGQVKIVDFGIAKAAGRTAETRDGLVKGKVAYMAPEQPVGGPIDRRVDVFSVGVMLWDLAVGERMWKGVDELAIFHALVDKRIPRSPKEKNPAVPDEIDRICIKALAPDPNERYASAADLQTDLEKYLRGRNAYASSREVGDFVSNLFTEERERVKRAIETQLADLGTRSSQQLPELDEWGQLTQFNQSGAGDGPAPSETMLAQYGKAGIAPRPEVRPGSRILVIGALVAMILVVTLAGVYLKTRHTPVARVPTKEVNVGDPVEGGDVRLKLTASPPTAKFSIDDGPALENPYNATVMRDGSTHTLTIRAPGYKTQTLSISYSADVVIDLPLDVETHVAHPTAGGGPARPAGGGRPTFTAPVAKPSAPPPPPAPAVDATPPAPGRRQPRPIDPAMPQ